MPLPSDAQTVQTAGALTETLKAIFSTPPGSRPAHAKGILLEGSFRPSPTAASLSKAHHFNAPLTPITARFSSSTGIPVIPDVDPNGDPRGFAIRFNLPITADGRRHHTDIVTHSTPFFPTRTGGEFLEFLQALIATQGSTEKPSPVEKFLGTHPGALAFVQAPKPTPSSFAREPYFGVNAFKLINSEGKETFVRYSIKPDAGVETLDEQGLKDRGPNFLHEEIHARVATGPVTFTLRAQIAEEGDTTNDATVHWPDTRQLVDLGTISLERVDEDNGGPEQKKIIFDPIPRVDGVEASDDPLLEMRAGVYLISGKQRRDAPAA